MWGGFGDGSVQPGAPRVTGGPCFSRGGEGCPGHWSLVSGATLRAAAIRQDGQLGNSRARSARVGSVRSWSSGERGAVNTDNSPFTTSFPPPKLTSWTTNLMPHQIRKYMQTKDTIRFIT